jgi:uncharacterized membrane protein (DUF485 family)
LIASHDIKRYAKAKIKCHRGNELVNYRQLLIIATLLPMAVYYLQLGLSPEALGSSLVLGIPGSIFWGVSVMLWAVCMAIIYVILHQRNKQAKVKPCDLSVGK